MMRILYAVLLLAICSTVSAATIVGQQVLLNNGYVTTTWEALAKNDVGSPAPAGTWKSLKTVQIVVTAAGEQSVGLQGSLDNVTWYTLHAIELDTGEYFAMTGITTNMMVAIIEDPLYIRPIISNEGGATAVDIDVIIGANTRL